MRNDIESKRIARRTGYRVELALRHCSTIILHLHPELPDVRPEDCRDKDEYRDIRRLQSQAENNGKEAQRWRRLNPPLTADERWQEVADKRQSRINGELSVYDRI